MKIVDYTPLNIAFHVTVLFCYVGSLMIDISSIIITPLAIYVAIYAILDLHKTIVDETGITMVMLFGIIKVHYCWSEISLFSLEKVFGGPRCPDFDVLVFYLNGSKFKPTKATRKACSWYWRRYKSMVIFRATAERYEYVRQFCDLPLIDNR